MPKKKTNTTSANLNTIDVLKSNLVEQPISGFRSYGSDWEGINRDEPSKADEIIDWGIAKKLMKGKGFERDEDLAAVPAVVVVLRLIEIQNGNAGDRIERT
ncbi:hypothetical protein DVH24_002381 [Malus domestica]|uniref:Uncharacterized protein n=1 Tax=Malus domestica TaxID=3750 RepID=A0A498J4K7_MALDO|nr:hypothetical protein DVH24_042472 [Malus domestica]RXI10017.1 hypothetical protein DVH24_002381 [Malus domestica]